MREQKYDPKIRFPGTIQGPFRQFGETCPPVFDDGTVAARRASNGGL